MSELIQQIVVLVMIFVIALVILSVNGLMPKVKTAGKSINIPTGKPKGTRPVHINVDYDQCDFATRSMFTNSLKVYEKQNGSYVHIGTYAIDNTKAKQGINIGRAEDNDVVLKDGCISSLHCSLGKDEKGYYLIDQNSLNGIYKNTSDIENTRRVKQINMNYGVKAYIADCYMLEIVSSRSNEPTKNHIHRYE